MWKFCCDIHSVITCLSVWELKTCIQSWECKSASMRVCTCANNTQKLKWKITPLLCPVSITNKARHWRRTNGNSGSCCCLMCLCVVVVSLFRLCHITRVYVRFFHSYMLYTVSLSSQCRLSVVFVFVVCGLICFFPFLLCFTPYPTDLHLGKQKCTLQFKKTMFDYKQHLSIYTCIYNMYMYSHTGCMH